VGQGDEPRPVRPLLIQEGDAALEVADLVKQYDGHHAVDGVSFRVAPATVLALLGPNGAGKTTTVEICEGFRHQDAGTVRVLGRDPRDRSLRPRVGVMPQSGGAYPGLRAEEMLRLVASYAAVPLDVDDLLDRLALTGVRRTAFRRLSGGQQQRLSLAMAVIGRPELVFLDEPTAGLDPQARHATWELVEALRADGVSVVLTTHLLDEAERLADQVVVMDAGQVVAAGTVAELTRSDGELRFRAAPGLDLAGLSGAREENPGQYVVAGRVDPQRLAEVTAWCAARGVMPEGLRSRSLEDVFLELTGHGARP
jgi:ABC-2 type transport system ATP-binding protein